MLDDAGCSRSVLVIGDAVRPSPARCMRSVLSLGAGDYCDVADVVLEMRDYHCHNDITCAAKGVAEEMPSGVGEHQGMLPSTRRSLPV